mmetsp:Transcript_44326/g.106781  ORF Transcript_44326/g.106781 Transcript_44326/m.106781 type:complete len:92 (-) Transcript_44326:757-1032(-)
MTKLNGFIHCLLLRRNPYIVFAEFQMWAFHSPTDANQAQVHVMNAIVQSPTRLYHDHTESTILIRRVVISSSIFCPYSAILEGHRPSLHIE